MIIIINIKSKKFILFPNKKIKQIIKDKKLIDTHKHLLILAYFSNNNSVNYAKINNKLILI
jgi:hypothetical protein